MNIRLYNQHLNLRMERYNDYAKKYDLNYTSIVNFAKYLEQDNLVEIKNIFKPLTPKQKRGLLNFYIDYNDFKKKYSLSNPKGRPISLAVQFGYQEIAEFLIAERDAPTIAFANKALIGLFSPRLPKEVITNHMAKHLSLQDTVQVVKTKRASYELSKEEAQIIKLSR